MFSNIRYTFGISPGTVRLIIHTNYKDVVVFTLSNCNNSLDNLIYKNTTTNEGDHYCSHNEAILQRQ